MQELAGILELNKSQGFYIDIGTEVYLEIEGVNFSVTSIFIGMLKDEFMIVTLPKKYKSVKNKLFPTNKIVVKYLYEGSIYAFQSSVIEMLVTPIRTLAIEYPKVVQQKELRLVKRYKVVIPGRFEAKKAKLSMVVYDITKKGCSFKYRDKKRNMTSLREGDLLRVYCQFPGIAKEIGAMASVRNVRRDQETLSVGVEFQNIPQTFSTPLKNFLSSIKDLS